MAQKKIQGLTIEIGGDTSKLGTALKNVDKQLRDTQSELRDVNKALKLDPGNIELLADKQGLLQEAITESANKLQVLKDAYEQNLSNPDVGADEMKALKLEIDKATASLNAYNAELASVNADIDSSGMDDMSAAIDDAAASADNLDSSLQSVGDTAADSGTRLSDMLGDFGSKVTAVGDSLTKHITVPLTALSAGASKAWGTLDDAYDNLIKMTGASGDTLEELKGIFDDLYTDMPADSMAISKAVGEINTRFGIMGDELKNVSRAYVEYANLNDLDIVSAINDTQSAMVAWGISVNDVTGVLDTLNKTGQDTGADIAQIAQMSNQYQAIFEDMGYSFSDSAKFLGELSKNGLDASTVMGTLSRLFANGAKEGKSVRTMLFELQDAMASSDNTTEAYTELLNDLGKTGFVKLQKAIESGRLSFGLLNTTIEDSLGSVADTYDAIQSPTDDMVKATHKLSEAMAGLYDALAPVLVDLIEKAIPLVERFAGWWDSLGESGQQLAVKIGLVAAAAGPLLSISGKLISSFSSVTGFAGNLINSLGGFGSTVSNTAGQIAGSATTIASGAESVASSTASAASGLSSFAQSALGFVALGAGIALASAGLWALSSAAVKIAEGGWPAAAALAELVVALGALVAIFAVAGEALTGGAIGIGVFGAAVLAIGAGIGLLTGGLSLLVQQFPTLVEYGANASVAILELGVSVAKMASDCLLASPELLALGVAAVALSGSLLTCDVALATFSASVLLSAGMVGLLDVAMLAFNATMSAIKDNATETADSIKYIVDSVDVIEVAVNGLSDLVKTGLGAVVDFFKSSSTEPVIAWINAFTDLHDSTIAIMDNVVSVVESDIDRLASKISNTELRFGKVTLPHFSVDGVFDLQRATVPHINVDWYKNGAIFNSPQVVGVGDNKQSPEAVIPLNKLQDMVDFGGSNNSQSVNLLSQMVTLLSQYLPGLASQQVVLDTGVLVGEIDSKMGTLQNRRARQ